MPLAARGATRGELIRKADSSQHVPAVGEVTPSGWHRARQALKASPVLVGDEWEDRDVETAFRCQREVLAGKRHPV